MKNLKRVLLVMVSLALLAGIFPAALADDAESEPGSAWAGFDLSAETFGPLRVGMPVDELREALGDWTQAGEPELWGADGLEHWNAVYEPQGLTIGLARTPGDEAGAAVYSIQAFGPLEWKTARGLGINDPAELVKSLYGEVLDPEWDADANQSMLIGSVYGGIRVGLKDGIVESFYFGAMAE